MGQKRSSLTISYCRPLIQVLLGAQGGAEVSCEPNGSRVAFPSEQWHTTEAPRGWPVLTHTPLLESICITVTHSKSFIPNSAAWQEDDGTDITFCQWSYKSGQWSCEGCYLTQRDPSLHMGRSKCAYLQSHGELVLLAKCLLLGWT